jgi:hypothetical protein
LPKIFFLGIELRGLLESDIFSMTINNDKWPTIHTDKGTYLRAYNESIFKIRYKYKSIFFENKFRDLLDTVEFKK